MGLLYLWRSSFWIYNRGLSWLLNGRQVYSIWILRAWIYTVSDPCGGLLRCPKALGLIYDYWFMASTLVKGQTVYVDDWGGRFSHLLYFNWLTCTRHQTMYHCNGLFAVSRLNWIVLGYCLLQSGWIDTDSILSWCTLIILYMFSALQLLRIGRVAAL